MASGRSDDALDLWERLIGIAAELPGGFLDLGGLLGKLRGQFHLVALPDYREDWERLRRTSEDALDRVKESLGSRITLLRSERLQEITEHLATKRCLLLVGASGAGKSALAKIICRRRGLEPVLWLDGASADVQGLFALEQRLQLRNSLADLMRDTPGQALVVLDALESWPPQALGVAARLLELCASLAEWSVIMTIRPDSPRKLLSDLQAHADFETLQVLPIGRQELAEAKEALPELRELFLRLDLNELLGNLKVLDWLAGAFASGSTPQGPRWIKVSEVVDGLWEYWIGAGRDKRSRGELLKKLALREAESLRAGLGFSEFGDEEQTTLSSLEQLELLRTRDEHAFFQHELAGDWARLRILVERDRKGSLATDLAHFARSPRWPPAIRLFGERLLEQENSTDRWCALYDGLPDEPAAGDARGVLLESLFWAGNAAKAIERLWPRLVADEGELLRRLLRRFLYSATNPDSGAVELAEDDRTAGGIRSWVRIPYWPLWKPVLRALDRHRDDVAMVAPELGAKVCGLWLRTVPRQWPWRLEAARVACRIAREAKRDEISRRKHRPDEEVKRDQEIYEAALWGAPDLPDEISELALELAGRKEELPGDRESTWKPRRTPIRTSSARLDAQEWAPFPDGPRKVVDEAFRSAVLGSQALTGLIACRPKLAREVLLACCLRASGPDLHTGSFGTIDRFSLRGASPPMFFQGPFLQFLKLDVEHGLDAILRLVNQATANWVTLQRGEAAGLVPWGAMAEWKGDEELYSWYRQHLAGPSIVITALMALEKWLYDLVDESRDIEAFLSGILARSRSVAFAGLLVGVGKKSPELFTGPLLPLLSCWPLYRWDRFAIEHNELYRSDLSEFVDFGERVFEMVRGWHTLPHRRLPLLKIALELLLQNPTVARAFESFRVDWQEQLRSGTLTLADELEQLLAFFDPANYRSLDVASFECPETLREKNERQLSAVLPDLRATALTERCRGWLEERAPLTPDEAEQVWGALVELDRLARERNGFSLWTDTMTAGIAVLLDVGRDWIAAEPARLAWCRERLAAILYSPPTPGILDGSSHPMHWQWPSFVAISGVLLLALDGNDLLARRIVAAQVVGLREYRIALIFRYGFRERRRLGQDWGRLQGLAVLGAALRSVGHPAAEPTGDILHSWASRLAGWFVQRRLRPRGPSWERASDVALRLRERLYQKEHDTTTDEFAPQRFPPASAVDPGFDLLALEAAFAWLPRLGEAGDEDERLEWVHLHRELLRVAERMQKGLQRLGPDVLLSQWGSGILSEYERWLSPYLARLIPQLATPEERRSFWEPVLRSYRGAETFMNAWFSDGPQAAGTPESFVGCWEEMIRYALSCPGLVRDTDSLFGMDWRAMKLRSEEYRSALTRLLPLFEQWVVPRLRRAEDAQRLAGFLLRPAALDFICPGIRWLSKALPSLDDRSRTEEEAERLDHTLVDVLRVGWTQFRDRIQADSVLLNDFQDLLSWLTGHGGAAALDLRDEIRRSLLASR